MNPNTTKTFRLLPATTRLAATLLTALLLAACAVTTPETQFYSLSPIDVTRRPPIPPGEISLGVGPLDFPKLLNRPQIVTRKSDHKIELAEFHQWGGSLEEEFLHVLADNLSTLLGASRVYVYPWDNRKRPEYQLRLNVDQFDGKPGESLTLRVKWQLMGERGKREITVRRSVIKETIQQPGYTAYVAAQSRALAKLAEEIATAITAAEE